MHRILLLTLVGWLMIPFAEAQEWQPVADLPSDFLVHHGVGFGLNGKGYLVTGASQNGYRKDFYQYDPATNSWSKLPDFPGPARSFAIGDTYNGKAYIGFGVDSEGNSLNDLWEFDPVDTSWTQLSDCSCIGRAHPAFVAQNGKIYMGLGNDASNLRDWWIYDMATDSWERGERFPAARRHHPFQFGIGNDVFAGLGHGDNEIFDEWYRYDPEIDQWTQVENIPAEGRVAGTQFAFDERGYVLSGDGDDHSTMPTGEFWKYIPEEDRWEQLPPHPGISRWAPSSFIVEDKIYFMGGIERSPFQYPNEVWSYQFISVRADVIQQPSCPDVPEGEIALTVNGDTTNTNVQILWEDGDTNYFKSGLTAGNYSVRVVRGADTLNYEFTLEAEDELMAFARASDVNCALGNDGQVELTIVNGADPVQIQWSTGDTGTLLLGLTEGWYSYELSDARNCSVITDSVFVAEPDSLSLTIDSVRNTNANDGRIYYSFSGGTGNIILHLVNETGDTVFSNFNGSFFQNLLPGVYSIRTEDENDCTQSFSNIVVADLTSTDQQEYAEWGVYPNPVIDRLYLKQEESGSNRNFQLFNQHGKLLHIWNGRQLLEGVSVQHLPSGIYWLRGQSKDGSSAVRKLIKP